MASVSLKSIVDEVIRHNGFYPGDPCRVIKVVEYTDAWGGTNWGLVYEIDSSPGRYEVETDYVRDPRVIWVYER